MTAIVMVFVALAAAVVLFVWATWPGSHADYQDMP